MLVRTYRLLAIVIFCCALSFGCTGLQVKRGVDGNTLYSSARPRLNVETGPGFKLMKEEKGSNSQFFANSDGSTNIEREEYRFWNNEKKREVLVQFLRIGRQNAYWNRFDFKGAKNLIDAGVETLNNEEYQYGVYPVANDNGCFLVKAIGRRIGAKSDTKMLLFYVQKLGDKGAISKWTKKGMFDAEQNKRLQAFLNAFKGDVKIVDYAEKNS